MNITEILLRVIFPVLMAIAAAAISFLFRRTDRLNEQSIRQDERIRHRDGELQEVKNRLDKIELGLHELPDRIVKRIKEGS